jgi:hypothetical protein
MMGTSNDIAERLAVLEKEVAELKLRVEGNRGNWPDNVFGRMADFPEFDEVVRLGRELRDAQTDPQG